MSEPTLHRLLLRFYPRDFRERYGTELSAFWKKQSDESRYRGVRGRARLAWHVTRDAVVGGSAHRVRSLLYRRGGREETAGTIVSGNEASAAAGRGRGPGGGDWNHVGRRRGGLGSDVRYAFRSIRGAPIHALVVVLTLGLGIGATTAILGVIDGVLLQPLPYPDADELVLISADDGVRAGSISWTDFRDWREQASGFAGMAAHIEADTDFGWEDGAELVPGARATRDLFRVMGVSPILGRTFTEDEDRMDGADAVILSWGLWQRRFGGDEDVLGQVLRVGGKSVPVIGVMPRGFTYPAPDVEYWQPLQGESALRDAGLPTGRRTLSFLTVVGRLSSDLGAATANLRTVADRLYEADALEPERRPTVMVESLQDTMVGDVRRTLVVFLVAVLMVLLVACANVAGLTFSRMTSRAGELGVRAALGASRRRLVRQLLTESFALALAAGLIGLALSALMIRTIAAVAPDGIPRLAEVAISPGALGFGALATVFAGLAFGIIPAVRATRGSVTDGLARRGRSSMSDRRALRPQQLLVVFQVSLAVAMLAGAALLVRSYGRLMAVEPGFATDGVVLAAVTPPEGRYEEPAAIESFYGQLIERVRALAGVAAATATYSPPLVGNGFRTTIELEGRPEDPDDRYWAGCVVVRDGYFETTGTPLLQGRDFNETDRLGGPPVAIVSEAMANELWPGENPIGHRFRVTNGLQGSLGRYDPRFFHADWTTVIGVAGDVRRVSLAEPPAPEYYRPHSQVAWGYQVLMIRTDGDASGLTQALRETIRSVDPSVPLDEVSTIRSTVHDATAQWRFRMLLLSAFGIIACLLAMLGVYAVMALAVAHRRKELGVRMALGATRSELLVAVLRRGYGLVGAGTLVGLTVAALGNRILESMLFEVGLTDPVTYAGVIAATTAVAMLACWLPARRASRVDPVTTLREE